MQNRRVCFKPIDDCSDDEAVPSTSKSTVKRSSLSRIKNFRARSGLLSSELSKKISSTQNCTKSGKSVRIISLGSPTSTLSSPCSEGTVNNATCDKQKSKATKFDSQDERTPLPSSKTMKKRFGSFSMKSSSTNTDQRIVSIEEKGISSSMGIVDEEEADPVMALFESRATQRVRFSLDDEIKANLDTAEGDTINIIREDLDLSNNSRSKDSKPKLNKGTINIKSFMKNALFGGGTKDTTSDIEAFEQELAREIETATQNSMDSGDGQETTTWTPAPVKGRNEAYSSSGPLLAPQSRGLKSTSNIDNTLHLLKTFDEDPATRGTFLKLLNKARRAQFVYFRYQYAVRTYVKALDLLKKAGYPNDHPAVDETMKCLNNAHFAVSSLKNSANIVKLGIKYEDSGELVRALKMYTIAYRIRRDNLSANHPSLVVLLNMLGSIQIKRGELHEAMAIYELALKDSGPSLFIDSVTDRSGSHCDGESSDASSTLKHLAPTGSHLTRSVTYREMGAVFQAWGLMEKALEHYHRSLECMAHHKGIWENYESPLRSIIMKADRLLISNRGSDEESLDSCLLDTVRPDTRNDEEIDSAGLELTFSETDFGRIERVSNKQAGILHKKKDIVVPKPDPCCYDVFFPLNDDSKKMKKKNRKSTEEKKGDYIDVEIAQTIHRIAQLHRSEGRYDEALPVFNVALRGMKFALGKTHPNVAAILGNIGNLQKEMGDMNAAYQTYQQVLAIEAYRLGLSHPDVVITLHNIATIDAARGNLDHSLSLYTQVLGLQRKLFGEDHESVAVTSSCMGDVYERLGDAHAALDFYEEALRIKILSKGRHSLDVARLLHKLGKLAVSVNDYHLALSYLSKATLVYRLNKLQDDDEWMIDVTRANADVEASIAMGRGVYFEC